jgi:hypothetical protein
LRRSGVFKRVEVVYNQRLKQELKEDIEMLLNFQ